MLEDRLSSLRSAKTDLKTGRPYPPVFPKFANPDEPSQVWSGRGKRPQGEAASTIASMFDISPSEL